MLEPKSIDIGDVLKDIFRFTFKDYAAYLAITLCTVGPLTFATQWFTLPLQQSVPTLDDYIPLGIVYLIGILVTAFVFGSIAVIGHARMRGTPISLGEALGIAARRFFRVLLMSIVFGLATALGIVACCVPGLFLMTALYPILVVAAIEDRKLSDIPSRAWDLTDGNRWSVFAILVLLMVANFILQLPFIGLTFTLISQPELLAALLALREVLVTPFVVMSMTTLYVHLKRAVDNLDADDVAEVFS